ncbi:MAG: hypothetical protein PF693_20915 [Spirochaetia bacterium]|jgi:glutaredoxin|nr:hypothetical protein [Spirochaetia bacterium]
MEILYYKSAICPKCIPTSRFLKELKSEHPQITIKEIEIITHLKSSIKDKVYSIPVIEVKGKRFYNTPAKGEILGLLGIK